MLILRHNIFFLLIFLPLFILSLDVPGKSHHSPEIQELLKQFEQKRSEKKETAFQIAKNETRSFIQNYPGVAMLAFKAGSYLLASNLLDKYAPELKDKITFAPFLKCAPADMILTSTSLVSTAIFLSLYRLDKNTLMHILYETGRTTAGFTSAQIAHTLLEKYCPGYHCLEHISLKSFFKTIINFGTYLLSDEHTNPVDAVVYKASDCAYNKMIQEFMEWQHNKNNHD